MKVVRSHAETLQNDIKQRGKSKSCHLIESRLHSRQSHTRGKPLTILTDDSSSESSASTSPRSQRARKRQFLCVHVLTVLTEGTSEDRGRETRHLPAEP